jgi:protoporphyrinogen oxidase
MARVGVVGGGVLGLTLAFRFARLGHQVEVFEAAPTLGGLAGWHDYGPFVWDRFYHCILPQDTHLLGLLEHLDLGSELRWRQTGTGYYAGGRSFPMSKSSDYLRFPLLSWIDKARVGLTVVHAAFAANPRKLYGISAEDWLIRWCGRRGYEVFWRPLLKAKFGPFYDQVAAVFIWATITRLFAARSGARSKEKLGYVRGGYRTILDRFEAKLRGHGTVIHQSAPVVAIAPNEPSSFSSGCTLTYLEQGERRQATFDQVFFTGPTRLARSVVGPSLETVVERTEKDYPAAASYLGVACLTLVLRRSLSPFYVLNIGDEKVELTGVIEMTNLIDRQAETGGLSLVYLPSYMDSSDPRLARDDGEIERTLMDRGLKRLFPDLSSADVIERQVHRAKFVQPLPLVRDRSLPPTYEPALSRPFQILTTSMLTCATLNNDEVVSFVDRFVTRQGERELGAP